MATKQDNLIDWLKDAHAMEQQAEHMLKAQASRLENYPKLRSRIEKHLEETLGQQKLLEAALENLGTYASTAQDACEQILPQEIAMADWLKEHLSELTHAFLDRSEAPGLEAKR